MKQIYTTTLRLNLADEDDENISAALDFADSF